MDVNIGGVEYRPVTELVERPTFAVAITTRNRNDLIKYMVGEIKKFSPFGTPIFVVDDASTDPVVVDAYTHRFDTNVGIARAKNKCLELMMAAGVDHMFLLDDDCYPKADDWWKPYVASQYDHLMYLWKDIDRRKYLPTPATLYDDGRHYAYAHPRGCALYLTRGVVERVGGMRPEFGIWSHEHVEYSARINAAGLTPFRFMDVCGSSDLWYAIDEHYVDHPGFTRSVDAKTRNQLIARNDVLLREFAGTTDFVEYRDLRNVVVTCLLTGKPEPQHQNRLRPDTNLLAPLLDSLAGIERVVVHNEDLDSYRDDTVFRKVQVSAVTDVYHQRWVAYWEWLKDNPDVRMCWFVDGTDVQLLHDPFPSMEPGRLYVGYEPTVVGCTWMVSKHAGSKDWIVANGQRTLVNAGVVGGDRATVLQFIHTLIECYADDAADGRFDQAGDMAHFNRAAYAFEDILVTGPQVTTVFKTNDVKNPYSWWAHK